MMKKISLVIAMLILFATVANASVNGYIDGRPIVKVMSNGKVLEPTGTPAMIYNDYTLVPINILRQLGFTVTWSQETFTVTITPPPPVFVDRVIEYYIDAEGETIPNSNTPPLDAEGTTIIPPFIPPTNQTPVTNPTTEPDPIVNNDPIVEDEPVIEPDPTPDNAYACQQIRDDYTLRIFNIDNTKPNGWQWTITQLQNQRDQALANAGC